MHTILVIGFKILSGVFFIFPLIIFSIIIWNFIQNKTETYPDVKYIYLAVLAYLVFGAGILFGSSYVENRGVTGEKLLKILNYIESYPHLELIKEKALVGDQKISLVEFQYIEQQFERLALYGEHCNSLHGRQIVLPTENNVIRGKRIENGITVEGELFVICWD
ncbi:hypothetical protein [Marinicella sp. W31]|uniref:hypothetical protein n=1 Tax=Marinicella sp. W31 TaxID=3023713 RepID=UPI0037577FBF